MKALITLLLGLVFSFSLYGEVWEKPDYQADENHLPVQKEEQEEKVPIKTDVRKHQDIQDDVNPAVIPGEDISEETSESPL